MKELNNKENTKGGNSGAPNASITNRIQEIKEKIPGIEENIENNCGKYFLMILSNSLSKFLSFNSSRLCLRVKHSLFLKVLFDLILIFLSLYSF